jgi:hypothetical protein
VWFLIEQAPHSHRTRIAWGKAADVIGGINVTAIMMQGRSEGDAGQGEVDERQTLGRTELGTSPRGQAGGPGQQAKEERDRGVAIEDNAGGDGQGSGNERGTPDAWIQGRKTPVFRRTNRGSGRGRCKGHQGLDARA